VQPWRRILYEKQPYPDNYTDESFLDSLVTNARVQTVPFLAIVRDAVVVSQRVAVLALFLAGFYAMLFNKLRPSTVIIFDVVSMMFASGFILLIRDWPGDLCGI